MGEGARRREGGSPSWPRGVHAAPPPSLLLMKPLVSHSRTAREGSCPAPSKMLGARSPPELSPLPLRSSSLLFSGNAHTPSSTPGFLLGTGLGNDSCRLVFLAEAGGGAGSIMGTRDRGAGLNFPRQHILLIRTLTNGDTPGHPTHLMAGLVPVTKNKLTTKNLIHLRSEGGLK